MYKRIPTQIVVAAFQNEHGVDAAIPRIMEAVAEGRLLCSNLAIIKKDKNSKISVKEHGKPGPLKGMAAGTAAGGALGALVGGASLMLLGPIGVAAGAMVGGVSGGALGAVNGAAIGTYAAATVKGMDKNKLDSLGSALEPETSAIVAVFGEVIVKESKYKEELEIYKEDTDKLVELMSAGIADTLKQGNDVAFLVALSDDRVVAMKKTTDLGEGAVNLKAMILTTDESKAAEVTVTEEGAAIQVAKATASGTVEAGNAVITDEGMVYEVAAAKNDEGFYEVGAVVPVDEEK